ncbi:MAG: HTR-like protein [Halobacteriales archaeon]
MARIPFGVSRLDQLISGGAPAGSVVLLAGDAGAGAREFLYTTGIMNGLADADADLFSLHYGDLDDAARRPEEIHYVSVTATEPQVREEMGYVMEDQLVEAGAAPIRFTDLSTEYFRLSPVPRGWYTEQVTDLQALGERRSVDSAFGALGDYLDDHASGNLVLIDSLTDFVSLVRDREREFGWSDLALLLQGLKKASHRWRGLVLPLVNKETLSTAELGMLMEASDGTLLFEWESGGSERARTLIVRQFRGVLSQLEADNIVRFETEIGDAGFDVSDVRKIR